MLIMAGRLQLSQLGISLINGKVESKLYIKYKKNVQTFYR